jgi:hypothetical protein
MAVFWQPLLFYFSIPKFLFLDAVQVIEIL